MVWGHSSTIPTKPQGLTAKGARQGWRGGTLCSCIPSQSLQRVTRGHLLGHRAVVHAHMGLVGLEVASRTVFPRGATQRSRGADHTVLGQGRAGPAHVHLSVHGVQHSSASPKVGLWRPPYPPMTCLPATPLTPSRRHAGQARQAEQITESLRGCSGHGGQACRAPGTQGQAQ